jgi:hypothetical protein
VAHLRDNRRPSVTRARHRLAALLATAVSSVAVLAVTPQLQSARAQTIGPTIGPTTGPTSGQMLPAAPPAATATVTAAAPAYPEPPLTALAAKAYAVLDVHCARCHQTGKLKMGRAARPTANILSLDEVAADPALVRAGQPDSSPLYNIMLQRHSPNLGPDIWPPIGEDLTASDVQAVRDWIQDLPAFKPGFCPGRPVVSPAATAAALDSALAALPEDKAKSTRFISLANLYNSCASYPELNGYRDAVTRVINSLSWKPEPVLLETIDAERTILKFDLTDAGWVDAHWEKLVQAYPHGGNAATKPSDEVRRRTGSAMPMVRGDWFAATAMLPPLYHSLLGLPARFANLQRILNTDRDANLKAGTSRRAAIAESTVTRAGRIAERHPTKDGSLWISYDFTGNAGRQNVLSHPLGPGVQPAGRVPFKHDVARALFTLPNGFLGFSVNDPNGDRLDRTPAQIDRDLISWSASSDNGLACAGCHTRGPLTVRDEVRAAADADKAMAKDLRDSIAALYPPESEFEALISDDHQRHRRAMQAANLNPDLTVHGLEPMTALARQYQKAGGLSALMAETGLSTDELLRRLADAPEPLKPALRRLKQGAVPRADLNQLMAYATRESGAAAAVAATPDMTPPRDLELQLWPSQDRYKTGELAGFFVQSNIDCNLTLVSVDAAGSGTVLFPNEFEQNNMLSAGKALRVPSEAAPFQLRLKTAGRETVVAVCNTVAKTANGIIHDFERQRFTILGDWRAFLGQLSLEAGADQKADRSTEARARARQPAARPPARPRPVPPAAGAAPGTAPATAPATAATNGVSAAPGTVPAVEKLPAELQARVAITVEVD